jgi:hypothetical protein
VIPVGKKSSGWSTPEPRVPRPLTKHTHKPFPTVVYKNAQRRYETLVPMHQKLEEKERTDTMTDGMREMSLFARKSSRYAVVCGYFDARRKHYLAEALQHYGQMKYRQRAFRRDQDRQKSEEALIKRIEKLQHNPSRPIDRDRVGRLSHARFSTCAVFYLSILSANGYRDQHVVASPSAIG